MSDIVFGVTGAGFVPMRLTDIKSDLENGFRSAFGSDVDVSADSVCGQEIGVLAKPLSSIWDVAADAYSAQTINGAEGSSLDDLGQRRGIFRNEATRSSARVALVALYGNEITISSGHKIRKSEGALEAFELISDITIRASNAIRFVVDVTGTPGAGVIYELPLSNTDGSNIFGGIYTALDTDTKETVAVYLATLINADSRFRAEVEGVRITIIAIDDTISFSVGTMVGVTGYETGTRGNYRSLVEGEVAGAPGVLSVIVTPVSGLRSVSNPEDIVPGSGIETDTEFRIRILGAVTSANAGTIDAIVAAMRSINGVTFASVAENRKGYTIGTLPPHSIAITIDGEEGIDDLIGAAIWKTKPAGIETFGTIPVSVADLSGKIQTVYFNRPATTFGYLRITTAVNPDTSRPVDWMEKIRVAAAVIGSKYSIGVDIPAAAFYAAIYSVPGIGTSTVEIAKGNPAGSYTSGLLVVDPFERIMFDTSRIEVS